MIDKPFQFLTSINSNRINEIDKNPECEKVYNSYLINRQLSYFMDTVLQANDMNRLNPESKLQYDYLLHSVSKKKRFAKWQKQNIIDDVQEIQDYYQCNMQQAEEIYNVLTKEQINELKSYNNKGGKNG